MTIQTSAVKVQSQAGITVHNSFVYHDAPASTKLMVMLPGRGYSCDHPVLYYVRRMAVKQGYDVLSVEYGFQAAHLELSVENTSYLQDDVWQAVTAVLQQGYKQFCIVGKSLGTPLAAELAKTIEAEDMTLILLTPIGGAFQGLGTIRTLAIIGTDDPLYSPEIIASLKSDPNIKWQVFDGLDHALEVKGDWKASITALERVITVCEAFITREEPA